MKRLVLLGATGSIGVQTIDVVLQHPDELEIVAMSAGHNVERFKELLAKVPVRYACIQEEKDVSVLKEEFPDTVFFYGDEGLLQLCALEEYDVLVNALVGFAGLAPTLCGIEHHHDIALANKEALVVGGSLVNRKLQEYGVNLVPIDSEHSAVFQCLQGNRKSDVKRLIITCSGGPFRHCSKEELATVTVDEALAHPNWSMGPKITIDSADMMNKGFEVMEAHWLFGMDYDHIDVVVHPESVIHSMVEYQDGAVMAQMGVPDMRLPIQYALSVPQRWPLNEKQLDLVSIGSLHFEEPDNERFPLLKEAYYAGKTGGNVPAVMNGANEEANLAFRQKKIGFTDITKIVSGATHACTVKEVDTLEDLIEADAWGRNYALERIKEISE